MQSVIRRLLTSSQGCGGRNLQPPPRRGTSARCARRLPDCWPTGFAAVLLREGQRGDLLSRFQRVQLLHFPQALSHPTQSELFCNNRSIVMGNAMNRGRIDYYCSGQQWVPKGSERQPALRSSITKSAPDCISARHCCLPPRAFLECLGGQIPARSRALRDHAANLVILPTLGGRTAQ